MELYKKPVMNVIEMEEADVLTASGYCETCGSTAYRHVTWHGYGDGCSDSCTAPGHTTE